MRPEELSKLPLALHARRGAKGLCEFAQSHWAHVSQELEALNDLRRAEVAERERLRSVTQVPAADKRMPIWPRRDCNLHVRIGLRKLDEVLLEILPAQQTPT